MDVTSVYRERINLKTGEHIKERLTHTECLMIIKDLNSELNKLGYAHFTEEPSNVCSTRITGIRLSENKIKRDGYNISPYTGRRGRVLGWENWVEVNNAINNVFDKFKLSGNISSLGGQFVIREGSKKFTEDDWEKKGYENVGSVISPVKRMDAWYSEGVIEKEEPKTQFGMMGESGRPVITHSIDLSKVKSSDPLAYAYGLVQGERGEPMENRSGLAPEYIRGWKDGNKKYKGGK